MDKRLILWLGLVSGLTCLGGWGLKEWGFRARVRSAMLTENYARIRDLDHRIHHAAAMNPNAFADGIGAGVDAKGDELSPAIRTNMFLDIKESGGQHFFRDSWGHGLNISLFPKKVASSNSLTIYVLRVWSDGPDGINDVGKRDDIMLPPTEIALEISIGRAISPDAAAHR